jgi:hypothetical protein
MGQHHYPAGLPQERDPVPIVQEAGWEAGPVLTGAGNLVPHWDLFTGPYSSSESLY